MVVIIKSPDVSPEVLCYINEFNAIQITCNFPVSRSVPAKSRSMCGYVKSVVLASLHLCPFTFVLTASLPAKQCFVVVSNVRLYAAP